ncbi:hypothetical protein AWE90_09185 [Escherichia coli]|nr:hypothetical protein AWE90_09185 [Escherichia coli]KZJ74285.1 hypothetical protein AWG99_12935 [Escherichia coli]
MENMTSPGTLLSGDNATWLEEYYQTWLRTPEQLPEDWRRFFLSPELTVQSVSGDNNVSGATLKKQAGGRERQLGDSNQVDQALRADAPACARH